MHVLQCREEEGGPFVESMLGSLSSGHSTGRRAFMRRQDVALPSDRGWQWTGDWQVLRTSFGITDAQTQKCLNRSAMTKHSPVGLQTLFTENGNICNTSSLSNMLWLCRLRPILAAVTRAAGSTERPVGVFPARRGRPTPQASRAGTPRTLQPAAGGAGTGRAKEEGGILRYCGLHTTCLPQPALLSYVLLLCYHCFTSGDWQSLNEKAAQPVVL